MRRRKFIRVLSLGGSMQVATPRGLLSQISHPTQPSRQRVARRPKIGSVSWNFHSLAPGAHPEESIDIIGSLGFAGIELIANSREDVDRYWTDRTIDLIKAQLERNHLVLSQFPLFQPVVEGLTSRNTEERKLSVEYFDRDCRIAKKLGAPMVNIVAPWARELSAPVTRYLPRYFMGDPKPGEKFHIDIAPGFHFDRLWDA